MNGTGFRIERQPGQDPQKGMFRGFGKGVVRLRETASRGITATADGEGGSETRIT